MHKQPIPAMAQDVIESGRTAMKNVIATGRAGTRHVLSTCDQVWNAGTNTLAYNPGLISQQIRDDLISLQAQLTLLTTYFAHSAADSTECAVDGVADAAKRVVGEYERVFDLRVMQAIGRAGMPIAEVIRALAEQVANLSQQLAALVAYEGKEIPAAAVPSGKAAPSGARKPAQRAKRARAA